MNNALDGGSMRYGDSSHSRELLVPAVSANMTPIDQDRLNKKVVAAQS